jgi:hypothetical protein
MFCFIYEDNEEFCKVRNVVDSRRLVGFDLVTLEDWIAANKNDIKLE